MEILLVIIGAIGLVMYTAILNSFVLSTLWGWFIVPLFHLPTLSPLAAFTVLLTLTCIRRGSVAKEDVDKMKFAITFISPWFLLLVGYVVKQFI